MFLVGLKGMFGIILDFERECRILKKELFRIRFYVLTITRGLDDLVFSWVT